MVRLELPLQGHVLRTTGDLLLRAELVLSLKTNLGAWEHDLFLVDSGTEMTTMPAARAKELDLPIPKKSVPGLSLHGSVVRSGLLRARIVGMDATEYVFPCYFLGDPGNPPTQRDRNVLGLTGVIDQIRLSFDGSTSLAAPYGVLVVEKR